MCSNPLPTATDPSLWATSMPTLSIMATTSSGISQTLHHHRVGKRTRQPKRAVQKTRRGLPAGIPDISTVTLEGEDSDTVKVFDTCDMVRDKIRAFLEIPGMSSSAFLRAVAKNGRSFQSGQMRRFLVKDGALDGNTCAIFLDAYIFFEKVRKLEGKCKSEDRKKMEQLHPDGIDTSRSFNYVWTPPGKTFTVDNYAVLKLVCSSCLSYSSSYNSPCGCM